MSSFEKVVKNACKPKPAPPKSKYIDPIIAATWSDDGAIHDVCRALAPRFREPNSIVVFKALIVLHTMIRNGATDNVLQYLSSSEVLRLKNVVGGQWEGYNAPTNLQHYALYLDTRIRSYRELKHDAIRVQSETNRDLRLSMSLEDDARQNRKFSPGEFQGGGGGTRRKTIMGRKLRVMTVEKGLLRETKVVQKLLDALVECRFYLDDLDDELTTAALRMVVKDLLILFQAVNEGVINVLEHYFEMTHVDAEQALVVYRHFCKQAEYAVEFLGVAKKLQNILNVPIPSLKHAPVSLVGALEEYLNDPNFEQNRIEYKANKDAADRSLKNGRTVLKKAENAPPTPVAQPTAPESSSSSKETPKVETTKALTDFFEVIENERTTIFNPQSGSLPSAQFQQANFNPFQAAGTSGSPTNPFPQFQAQPQPTGFLQPQFTTVPGAAQQSSNPFPLAPNGLQSQMTGANPFRAGTLPMQATGLSPFGQTNPPPPVPMVPNPFAAQNGLLGTNPFPTSPSTHTTNPFPSTGQTTNPFPTAGNANPFAVPMNNSAPNVTSPNQFPSPNSNPFPTQSPTVSQPFPFLPPSQPPFTNLSNPIIPPQTSNPTGPASGPVLARPASTPLTHRKPSSPPPQPLKPHQTGSRNPFGVPKAPSPPPVPRAPTLFELAKGATQPQPQPQSQSPVQVKPQQTGFPSTTFSSVASTFITGSTGSAQAPQPTTSSFTSLGSSSTSASTPTTTATGSTFSDSLLSSFGVQPTGSTALSSQPTGAPLRPQATGFNAGVKAFKPSSSFGASLLEALPPIPQSESTTPALEAASAAVSPPAWTTGTNGVSASGGVGLGAGLGGVTSSTTGLRNGISGAAGFGTGLGGVSSPTTGVGTVGPGGSSGLSAQPTSSPTASMGSTIGVGLRPQATGFGVGLGAANPFRASAMTPGMGSAAGTLPPFNPANFNPGPNLFSQPTGVPSFGQSLFVGAQTDASKQQNGTTSLI